MNFIRKILGLGSKEPVNVGPGKKNPQIRVIEDLNPTLTDEDILPVLISSKTQEFDLGNEITSLFHEREGNYAKVVMAHVLLDKNCINKNGESELLHISTRNKDKVYYHMLLEIGQRNFDNFEVPFEFWNPTDKNLEYKVLSCKMSFFASQKIMSKKHMLEAHKLLNADELLVSIPRRELIFVCDKNVGKDHYTHFLNMHSYFVLQENEELEFLCEDIFVVKNGEIYAVLEITQLSEILINKNRQYQG
ncbi:hypothetical protein [Marinilabilia salmonicolor]|uniref:hypothetical protein n=1 Tax=Marinilabilia salmonicolor TaxID=989 RepID=UPI000299FB9C|nr:hypothetical protein [Marinilabilia salmonicolor]